MRWATVIALAVASLPRLGALQTSSLRSGSRLNFRLSASEQGSSNVRSELSKPFDGDTSNLVGAKVAQTRDALSTSWQQLDLDGYQIGTKTPQNDKSQDLTLLSDRLYELGSTLAGTLFMDKNRNTAQTSTQIESALQRTYDDVAVLDKSVNKKAQISVSEIAVLAFTALAAAGSPFLFGEKMVEVLVPSLAAISAAIGLNAEYNGKVSVFTGKEIAAVTVQTAAESEMMLASAERSKSVIPLCVGVSTLCGVSALLAPSIFEEFEKNFAIYLASELLLVFPIISVLGAAIAGLAIQETKSYCARAIGTGRRRFASANGVGETWLSASEQIELNAERMKDRFRTFALGILPAPILAALCPGPLAFKAVVCATSAAAQAAYYLSIAEYNIARAMDAVSLKMRAAAVADAYSNQGARSGSILPFTSALGGLCAAATAAVVEILPLVHTVQLEAAICFVFPAFGALFASAASVSKARCKVNMAATKTASDTFAKITEESSNKGAMIEPIKGVQELIRITLRSINRTYLKAARSWLQRNPGVLFLQRMLRSALGLGPVEDRPKPSSTAA